MFDPETIMDVELDGSNSTQVIPVPEKDDYIGLIKDEKSIIPNKFYNTETGKTSYSLDIVWHLDDEDAKAVTGKEEPTVRQKIWLDVTPDGKIDMSEGKNVGLGRLREAIGKNEGAFSFRDLVGQIAQLRVKHRMNGEDTYAEVRGVKAAA